jgi:hypothetical protein
VLKRGEGGRTTDLSPHGHIGCETCVQKKKIIIRRKKINDSNHKRKDRGRGTSSSAVLLVAVGG